jgi:hypothetical protein
MNPTPRRIENLPRTESRIMQSRAMHEHTPTWVLLPLQGLMVRGFHLISLLAHTNSHPSRPTSDSDFPKPSSSLHAILGKHDRPSMVCCSLASEAALGTATVGTAPCIIHELNATWSHAVQLPWKRPSHLLFSNFLPSPGSEELFRATSILENVSCWPGNDSSTE